MRKLYHKTIFYTVMLTGYIVCAQPGGPANPPGPPGDGTVDDVLPLEQDLLMIFLGVALAVFYFKRSSLFGLKKK